MQLVKAICAVQFKNRLKVLSGYESLYHKLIKQEVDDTKNWLVPGLTLTDKDSKRKMVVDAARCVIDIEQPPNEGYCKDSFMNYLTSVNKEYAFPEIARWGVRFYWIQDSDIEFSQLISEFKAKLFRNSALLEEVDDVGAALTVNLENELKININMGPMEKTQLQSMLAYPLDVEPSTFIFIDTDLGGLKPVKYSDKYLSEFIDIGLSEGKRLAEKVINLMEGE